MDYTITKITLIYNRTTKIEREEPLPNGLEYIIWNYSERLILDRVSESIDFYRKFGSGCDISTKYHVEEGVSGFLDEMDGETLFVQMTGDSTQIEQNPLESKQYEIVVEFMDAPMRKICGVFDGNGLPDDYAGFIDDLDYFISFYGFLGELFNKRIYKYRKKKRGEYIFCSVEFENASKSYYYLTDDESLQIDDFVVVPVGKNNRETVALIVDVEYFNAEEVPMPLDKVKRIVRRADEEKDNFSKEWFD